MTKARDRIARVEAKRPREAIEIIAVRSPTVYNTDALIDAICEVLARRLPTAQG